MIFSSSFYLSNLFVLIVSLIINVTTIVDGDIRPSNRLDVDKTVVDFADLLYPCQRLRHLHHGSYRHHKSHGNKETLVSSLTATTPSEPIQDSQSPPTRAPTSISDTSYHHFGHENSFKYLYLKASGKLPSTATNDRAADDNAAAAKGSTQDNVEVVPSVVVKSSDLSVSFVDLTPPQSLAIAEFNDGVDSGAIAHDPTYSPTGAPSHEPFVAKRLPHIEPIPAVRHEMSVWPLITQYKQYPTFKAYVQNNAFLDDNSVSTSTSDSGVTASLSDVWKPSPHPLPYAYYDLNSHHTRLTWCEHDKQLLDHIPTKGGSNGTASGNDFLWNSMRNRRLMFVGDSVTRYQYLDLIYFLTNKKFNHELKLINEKQFNNWNEFFDYTYNMFNTDTVSRSVGSNGKYKVSELCECYREMTCCDPWHINENRKFHNEELNTTVWFFTWFGTISMPHGHFTIEDDIQPLDCMPNKCDKAATNHSWIANSTAEFVYRFAVAHRPDHVIINTGLHTALDGKNNFFIHEAMEWKKYALMLQETQEGLPSHLKTKVVYKSITSLVKNDHIADQRELDLGAYELAANGVWEYWDVASTIYELYMVYRKLETAFNFYHGYAVGAGGGNRGFGWDEIHYTPWVYRELNKLLIVKFYSRL